jgi:hypothetical protein
MQANKPTTRMMAWLLSLLVVRVSRPSPPRPALQTNDKMAAPFSRWSLLVVVVADAEPAGPEKIPNTHLDKKTKKQKTKKQKDKKTKRQKNKKTKKQKDKKTKKQKNKKQKNKKTYIFCLFVTPQSVSATC